MVNNKNILIVEDEENISLAISIILRREGYKVSSVKNGLEALNFIFSRRESTEPVGFLLTDIEMPDLTGKDLIIELKKANCNLPVLVITGYNNENVKEEISSIIDAVFINKPFSPKELVKSVKNSYEKFKTKSINRNEL